MRSVITSLGLLLTSGIVGGQNLVPNGSFEDYYSCPTNWGQWQQAQHWISPYNQSADYFNACTGDTVAGVPYNQFGYQYAADGDAYMGIGTILVGIPLYREMIQVELIQPLQVGVPVCLSFKMAVGGFGSTPFINSAIYTCKGVGMRFFEQLPTNWAEYLYPNSAALYLDQIPMDTSIWYELSTIYTPDSSYTYLILANFFEDSLSGVTLLDTEGYGNTPVAYAFIDDVRVSFDLNYCDGTTGTVDQRIKAPQIYPNPFNDKVELLVPDGLGVPFTVELRNSVGQMVTSSTYHGLERISLSFPPMPEGPYLLRVSDAYGVVLVVPVAHLSP